MTGRAEVGDVSRRPGKSSVDVEAGMEWGGTDADVIDPGMADERKAGGATGCCEKTVGGTPSRRGEFHHRSIDEGVEHEADGGPSVEVGGSR